MYSKIIYNDIRKSKLITVTITAFILAAAMLTSLATALIINLLGAIDHMLVEAKSPHFMQMHTGDFNMERLENFAVTHDNVEAFQALEFLNIDGAEIFIGDNSLAWSIQDNGFAVQSELFDFLLDMNGEIIRPADGEVYLPIYYMKEGVANVGDTVTIRDVSFTVAGFLRDSQMNAALVTSKRFLVSNNDFEKIREFGIMEHLIEFRLKNISATADFENDYLQAELPANGPPVITYPIIRIINGIADGIMIAVLALISILVIVVAFLCIRFTMLVKIEEDYKEIGVLKAVGLRVTHIKKLYTAKYGAITGFACVLGFFISLLIQKPFMKNIRLYMGESNRSFHGLLFGFIGAAVIFGVVMLYVNNVLRRFRKISAAQAIRFGAPQEKSKSAKGFLLSRNRLFSRNVFLGIKDVISRKKLYVTMLTVLIISTFIINVPRNIYNTISSNSFVTYMGIGLCDMRFDIMQTQTDNIPQRISEITHVLSHDDSVSRYAVITTLMFEMKADDGSVRRLRADIGDHSVFPIIYSNGRAPQNADEIAISTLYSDDLEKAVGDEIILLMGGGEKRLTVCGIYSDITSGGKTAKAVFEQGQAHILGSSISVAFNDTSAADDNAARYREMFPFAKVSSVDENIEQTFGSTIAAVRTASYVSIGLTVLLTVLVTLLFMKMLVTKDRYSVAVLKSLGFTNSSIRTQYKTRGIIVMILGVIIGTLLSNTLGELVGAALISSFGATTFNFVVEPIFVYLFSPLLIASCVYMAAVLGISGIGPLKVSEYIKEV